MCIDYRAYNIHTKIDAYPCIDSIIYNILYHLGGPVILSKIDLAQCSHQVWVAKDNKHRTTFQMHFGLFKYCVFPF